MYNELSINIGENNHKVFLQDGFYSLNLKKMSPHKHNYAEIHIVADDSAVFHVGESLHSSADGNLVMIPPDVFHRVESNNARIRHTAFQIDLDVHSFSARRISNQTVLDFMAEIEKSQATNNYAAVATYISLLCSYFSPQELSVRPVHDYKFLICEFFFKRYHEDLHLCDLAKELHLSERQTERLVIQTTGRTFRHHLAFTRINVAKHLLKTTAISLEEVSHHVGYHSYAGFWKAMKKYDN